MYRCHEGVFWKRSSSKKNRESGQLCSCARVLWAWRAFHFRLHAHPCCRCSLSIPCRSATGGLCVLVEGQEDVDRVASTANAGSLLYGTENDRACGFYDRMQNLHQARQRLYRVLIFFGRHVTVGRVGGRRRKERSDPGMPCPHPDNPINPDTGSFLPCPTSRQVSSPQRQHHQAGQDGCSHMPAPPNTRLDHSLLRAST